MEPSNEDLLRKLVERDFGDPGKWTLWPGGWPGEISTSLIDAVYSARAVYETRHGKGVLPKVKVWRDVATPADRDSLSILADAVGDSPQQAADWATKFGSSAHAPGRRRRLPDDPLKVAAVRDAARLLVAAGYDHAADVTAHDRQHVRKTLRSVIGVGKVTSGYFLMLLGHPGVKADVMVLRFLARATSNKFTTDEAVSVVARVAATVSRSAVDLEHAIWAFESEKAKA